MLILDWMLSLFSNSPIIKYLKVLIACCQDTGFLDFLRLISEIFLLINFP